jgi:hypothetical protein
VAINNQLVALSEAGSTATIAKRNFNVTVDIIPEPSTFALTAMAVGSVVLSASRRRA